MTQVLEAATLETAAIVRGLRFIHEATPRTSEDDECFAEAKSVMQRWGLEEHFGLTLLHKHFDIDDGEVMVEQVNVQKRMLTVEPMKTADVAGDKLTPVTWTTDSSATASEAAVPLAFALRTDDVVLLAKHPNQDRCFAEIKEVLHRHNRGDRFGLTMLDRPFAIDDDEMMVEHTNLERRRLTSVPMRDGDVPDHNLIDVTWALGNDSTMMSCITRCRYEYSVTRHVSFHEFS